jgi:hypothetical protein
MTTLRTAKVYRSTKGMAPRQAQTTACSLSASNQKGTLDISFDLTSKGAGKTHVVVAMGKSDLTFFIREAVSLWPDLGPALTESIVGTMAVVLEKQRTFHATVAKRALRQLEHVDHTLDALSEEDLPRSAVRKVINAGTALEDARGVLEAL